MAAARLAAVAAVAQKLLRENHEAAFVIEVDPFAERRHGWRTIFRYPSAVFARTRLLQLAEGMKGRRIVVYGDIVADRFIYGTPKRISREAPVLILRQYRDDVLLGAAGNAINNIASLGGVPIPVSVLGEDSQGQHLVDAMTAQGIDCRGVVRAGRYNTPTKVRILGGMPHASRQQIVRYDIEDHCDLTESEAARFDDVLREQMAICHAGLISDYGYGTVTQPLAAACADAAAAGKPVTLDSRYNLLRYPGVTAATPNEEEAAAAQLARRCSTATTASNGCNRSAKHCRAPSDVRRCSSRAAAAAWRCSSARRAPSRSSFPSTAPTRLPTSPAPEIP